MAKTLAQLQSEAALDGKVTKAKLKRSDAAIRQDPETGFALDRIETHLGPDAPDEVELIHQEGYGFWPSCSICGEQVEPTSYSTHTNEHGG
jgi:hypothetical protein